MKGTIHEIKTMSQGGKIILYKNINTSGGQSGSPVILIKKKKDGTREYHIIGVHVCYSNSIKANIATAITDSMYEWI